MKILYYGGQKSGKSELAENKAKMLAKDKKPVYLATYDDSFGDKEMSERIKYHQIRRGDRFKTVCEPLNLSDKIKEGEVYLIDCLGTWLLNALREKLSKEEILKELDLLLEKEVDMVFVLNEINSGVIPKDSFSRLYVDLMGEIGIKTAKKCDEVYHVILGIEQRIK